MIVDCFTHTWETDERLGSLLGENGRRLGLGPTQADRHVASAARHLEASKPIDVAFVLGFKSVYLGAEISNDAVAAYVRTHPDRLVGFAGIDPSDPRGGVQELERARAELGLKGVTVAPAAQGVHPANSQAMLIYAEAARRGLPVLFHSGVTITSATRLEYAQPVLLDEVAREHPTLKIIVAHMGFPWVRETLVLLAKHPNVYADLSWLLRQPWETYQALLAASQFGVMDKLLFGSGFPASSASECIESLLSLNQLVHGTNLPNIPREQLRQIVERDALTLLGIEGPRRGSPAAATEDAVEESTSH